MSVPDEREREEARPDSPARDQGRSPEPRAEPGSEALDEWLQEEGDRENEVEEEPSLLLDPSQILKTLLVVALLVVAIYILVPRVAGIEDAIAQLGDARRAWIGVALLASVGAFAAYVALFRGVISGRVLQLNWSESYQITMAGLAATRLFSAGGAGGIVLTYWALRKAGLRRAESARRMVAFLVLLYGVYVLSVIVFGLLLRVDAVPGSGPLSITVVPAAIAGAVVVIFLLIALIPGDLQRRLEHLRGEGRIANLTHRLATVPATVANGTRTALAYVRDPRSGWLALAGATGFWAANILILWASFRSLGVTLPLAEVVQGFFVGMVANLVPAPAGVGAVDGGLIGAFVILGYPFSVVLAAVLIYRLFAFWLPVPPGIVAFLQLRRTVVRWERERDAGSRSAVADPRLTS